MRRFFLGIFSVWVALSLDALAQQPAKPPPKNLVSNGGFERVVTFHNLYDGVNDQGEITVQRGEAPVFLSGSTLDSIYFACSPNFVDVNGDGLPDLVVASADGHLYWFPNIGTKTEPKFDHGILVQTCLGPAPRIYVCDWNGDGKMDILYGNVDGEVNVLLNTGSVTEPKWVRSQGIPRWLPPKIPHPRDVEPLKAMMGGNPVTVGVYSAPCFVDWNKSGIPSLIMGEGGYSANSVHIWLNSGSRVNPSFKPEDHFFLAYGEGKEQLTPAVYDWNGDGIPDLIVGDREGRLSLFLGTPEAIKDSKTVGALEFTKFLKMGEMEKAGSLISPFVCDWNGDGIPDVIYGTTSGHVMVCLGHGDRKDPELGSPTMVKGVNTLPDFKTASGWTVDTFSSLPEVLSKEDHPDLEAPEGKRCFHVSFFDQFWFWNYMNWEGWPQLGGAPQGFTEGFFQMQTSVSRFIMGRDYEFSFMSKGSGTKLFYNIGYDEQVSETPKGPPTLHRHPHGDEVSLGSQWGQTRRTYRLEGTKKGKVDTNGGTNDNANITFYFIGKGDGWLDDVRLNEVERK